MKEEIKTFLNMHPFSPLLTVPHLGAIFFILIPYASMIFLNSRSLVIASVFCGIVFIPWSLAQLHQIRFLKIAGIWCFFIIAALITMPKEWDGNPKLAFADHFMPAIVLSLFLSIPVISYLNRKKFQF